MGVVLVRLLHGCSIDSRSLLSWYTKGSNDGKFRWLLAEGWSFLSSISISWGRWRRIICGVHQDKWSCLLVTRKHAHYTGRISKCFLWYCKVLYHLKESLVAVWEVLVVESCKNQHFCVVAVAVDLHEGLRPMSQEVTTNTTTTTL